MNKNTTVDTAKKGQATTKNIGKVKTISDAEKRRKAREEQFRNFRINALRRRCKRMGFDDAKTEEYVKKLIEQLNAPKEYSILVMFNAKDYNLLKEAVAKAKINYNILTAGTPTKTRIAWGYMSLDGNQDILAKIREIAPASAKIYPYAKKMESVIDEKPVKKKKPTNNTVEKRKAAKDARKKENIRKFLNRKKGKGKAAARGSRKISLAERKKTRKATTIQLKAKKSSTGSKTASTNLKKAA